MSKLYFGGIPTEIELNRLKDKWPTEGLKVGDVFAYSDISALIGAAHGSHRFQVVTNRWRKHIEKERGLILGPHNAEAFVVLNDSEKLGLSRQKLRTSAKASRRSVVVLALTDRKALSDTEKAAYDHQNKIAVAILTAAQQRTGKSLLPEV